MPINFQHTDIKTSQLPTPGYYFGKIIEAVMKQPKDLSKSEYLNVTYDLLDQNKNKCGRVYDIIAESEKPFMIYKLQRFGQALGLTGKSLELKDLTKIIVGKEIIFSVKIEENEQYGDRAIVDVGDEGIYYAKEEASKFFTCTQKAPEKLPTEATDDSAPPFDVGSEEDF